MRSPFLLTGEITKEVAVDQLQKFTGSEEWLWQKKVNDYWNTKNDILERKREHIIGTIDVDKHKACNKRPHNFFFDIVKQHSTVLLGKAPSFSDDVPAAGFVIEPTSVNAMAECCEDYFSYGFGTLFIDDSDVKPKLSCVCSYLTRFFVNEKGKLTCLMHVEPISESDGSTTLLATVYTEKTTMYFKGNTADITTAASFAYVGEDVNSLSGLPVAIVRSKHTNYLFDRIKPLIDAYDKKSSIIANMFEDREDLMLVIKNYSANNIEEFLTYLSKYNAAFVRDNGDVTNLQIAQEMTQAFTDLDYIRQNIYHLGRAIDVAKANLGNATGVGLKFMYAPILSDVGPVGLFINTAVNYLLKLANIGEVELIYNIDNIISETEVITSLAQSKGLISNRTIVANHPYVTGVEAEIEEMKEEGIWTDGEDEYDEEQFDADMALFASQQQKKKKQAKPTEGTEEEEPTDEGANKTTPPFIKKE